MSSEFILRHGFTQDFLGAASLRSAVTVHGANMLPGGSLIPMPFIGMGMVASLLKLCHPRERLQIIIHQEQLALIQNSWLNDYDAQPPSRLEFSALKPPAYSCSASNAGMPEAQSDKLQPAPGGLIKIAKRCASN